MVSSKPNGGHIDDAIDQHAGERPGEGQIPSLRNRSGWGICGVCGVAGGTEMILDGKFKVVVLNLEMQARPDKVQANKEALRCACATVLASKPYVISQAADQGPLPVLLRHAAPTAPGSMWPLHQRGSSKSAGLRSAAT